MKIFITRPIPQIGLDLLSPHHDVDINPDRRNLSQAELADAFTRYDAIMPLVSDRIDAEVIAHAKTVKIIGNFGVGYDNIDVAAASENGILVSNTPGVLTEATAELTWALILAVARRIVEADQMVRAGKFDGWCPLMLRGTQLSGKTLGIIGMGRIGQAVARIGRGFGMNILFTNYKSRPEVAQSLNAKQVGFVELLARADVLSLHCPATPKTHHLIDADALRMMKKSAVLVNTARGAVVDEQALRSALQTNQIAGAGLDVYEREPNVTAGLSELANVVLLPHIGSATHTARDGMARKAAENILAALRGEMPPNCLNPDVFDKRKDASNKTNTI